MAKLCGGKQAVSSILISHSRKGPIGSSFISRIEAIFANNPGNEETNRAAYLKQIGGSGFKPENTILLSQIEGFPLLQLLIPPQLIKNPKVLKTTTQCAAKTDTAGVKAIAAHGNVDWSKWPNVKGTPQKP